MGQSDSFNEQLKNPQMLFMYFVPRNEAWDAIKLSLPSTYKKLFMPQFAYHVSSISLPSFFYSIFNFQSKIKH